MSGDKTIPVCSECSTPMREDPEVPGRWLCATCSEVAIDPPMTKEKVWGKRLLRQRAKRDARRAAARPHVPRFVMGPETLNRAAIPEGAPPATVCRHCRQSVAFAFSKDPPSILIKCDRCGWQIGIGLPGVLFEARGLIVTPGGVRRIVSEGSPALGPAAVDVETMLRKGPR